jgi:hypothetical protein
LIVRVNRRRHFQQLRRITKFKFARQVPVRRVRYLLRHRHDSPSLNRNHGDSEMTGNTVHDPARRKVLTPRRLTLMASVAALGLAAVAAGPANFSALDRLVEPAQAADAAQAPTGFGDLVAKVKPAVISVRVKIDETVGSGLAENNNAPEGLPPGMRKFFQQFGMPNSPNMPHGKQVITGEGSGFFISPDGYAVTNNHVVDHAKTVEVKTDDGASYQAKVIGTDPKTDLALIKVDADGGGRQPVRPRRHGHRRHPKKREWDGPRPVPFHERARLPRPFVSAAKSGEPVAALPIFEAAALAVAAHRP